MIRIPVVKSPSTKNSSLSYKYRWMEIQLFLFWRNDENIKFKSILSENTWRMDMPAPLLSGSIAYLFFTTSAMVSGIALGISGKLDRETTQYVFRNLHAVIINFCGYVEFTSRFPSWQDYVSGSFGNECNLLISNWTFLTNVCSLGSAVGCTSGTF